MAISERFVAVCDVLGFSELVKTTPLHDLCGRYQQLLDIARPLNWWLTFQEASGGSVEHLPIGAAHVVFSDTVLMWSDSGQWSTQALFEQLTAIIGQSILVGLPLRVGVAFGECEIDVPRSVYVGQAIVAAHEVEGAQLWIGGGCHPSCEESPWFRYYVVGEFDMAVEYPVPTRSGSSVGMALNWVSPRNGRAVPTAEIRDRLNSGAERATSDAAKLKWGNALAFFESQMPG